MTLVTQNQHALSELEVKLWPTADSTQWVDYHNWLSPLRLSPFFFRNILGNLCGLIILNHLFFAFYACKWLIIPSFGALETSLVCSILVLQFQKFLIWSFKFQEYSWTSSLWNSPQTPTSFNVEKLSLYNSQMFLLVMGFKRLA